MLKYGSICLVEVFEFLKEFNKINKCLIVF